MSATLLDHDMIDSDGLIIWGRDLKVSIKTPLNVF